MTEVVTSERMVFTRSGRKLDYFTIAWNLAEGLVAVFAGVFARSISLVGFGIDSFIEVTSGSVLLWRMSVDANVHERERNEKRALRIVGLCFLLLAVYIAFESGNDLWFKHAPEHSIPGIVLACASLVVMPLLSWSKRKGRPRSEQRCHACRREADAVLHVSFCDSSRRTDLERGIGVVVGRPARGPDHGSYHCERRI